MYVFAKILAKLHLNSSSFIKIWKKGSKHVYQKINPWKEKNCEIITVT
jgi:hypothetical protein